ncbi:MAG: hypothetical protein A3I75_01300 [Deltaproteobacteria bacterium RIFCSPLOWO2_02_FULL_50_16]|nr:MAG: hypothetical protein A2053_02760 [Deltaproteobacteria bacterium GWA2_50_8]OGQ58022.1 MAG: hypothetical protein A3I75_01300 [Deltaproteobacteria bacterium RIFCSPLOWO2_02_FULL_50_16]OGQ69070.1 MAG: hypothetical protein A3F89_00640 [Deltaproteobacteria bacterium RIFCSPLOWO2_12_FULL_50_11]
MSFLPGEGMEWLTNIPESAAILLSKIAFGALGLLILWPVWRVICWFWSSDKKYSKGYLLTCKGCGREIPLHYRLACLHCQHPYKNQSIPLLMRIKLILEALGKSFPLRLLKSLYTLSGWFLVLGIIALMVWRLPLLEHIHDWRLNPLMATGILCFFFAIIFLRKTFAILGEKWSTKLIFFLMGGTCVALSLLAFNVTHFFLGPQKQPLATINFESDTHLSIHLANGEKIRLSLQNEPFPLKTVVHYRQIDWPFIKTSTLFLEAIVFGSHEIKPKKKNGIVNQFWNKLAPPLSQEKFGLPTLRQATSEFYLAPGGGEYKLTYNPQSGRVLLNSAGTPPPPLDPTGSPPILPTPVQPPTPVAPLQPSI